MERILITGGAGFIGSHLVDYFLKNYQEVVVVDNLSTGRIENLDLSNPFLQFYKEDIRDIDYDLWKDMLIDNGKIDFVFHLASVVGVNNVMDYPLETINVNIFGSRPLVECACLNNIPILFTSSSEIYGKNNGEFIKETDDRVLGDVKNRRWIYACTKTLEEFYLLVMYEKYNSPIIIARLFNTIGSRQIGDYGMVVPRFIKSALNDVNINVYGDGLQKRSFCDVRDTVEMLVRLSKSNRYGEVFNIGNSQEISIEDLAHLIKRITKSNSDISKVDYVSAYGSGFEDMKSRRPDITKIVNAINYKPQYSLEESIEYIVKNTL